MAVVECGRRRKSVTLDVSGIGLSSQPSKVYSITFKELDAYTLFHGYYLDVRYVGKNGKNRHFMWRDFTFYHFREVRFTSTTLISISFSNKQLIKTKIGLTLNKYFSLVECSHQ